MRKKIFDVIEPSDGENKLSSIYDTAMMIIIVLSLVPIAFKQTNLILTVIEKGSTAIFIADYILRLATADLKLGKGKKSFVIYPFTIMALIDIICILPSLNILSKGFKVLKIIRLFRTFRVFRAVKMFRYSSSIQIIIKVIVDQRKPLLAVCVLAVGYILIAALVIFSVEPDTFDTFFDAIYWATVSLTTMGYGDIYPVSVPGKIVTMLSAFIGIAIIALPAGIITAGYMTEINKISDQGGGE